ncbi:RsiV family protein [Acinetobacter sp. WZC-1]|uniref:RsiV family protein n=1 Tax=Acinetobacter sp. WZC-1 TaxID=3459034 RepID=UPI00403D9F52
MLKVNEKIGLTVLAAALLLAACQPKSEPKEKTEDQQPLVVEKQQQVKFNGSIVKVNSGLPECNHDNCAKFEIERLQSNYPFIDKIIDQEILKSVAQVVETPEMNTTENAASSPAENASSEKTPSSTADQPLVKEITPYAQAFIQLDKQSTASSPDHHIQLMIKPSILKTNDALAVVALEMDNYLSGAHGSGTKQYYNFDLKQQKLMQLDDLLVPKQKSALEQQAHEVFKAWVMESELTDNLKEYEQMWKFHLSDNFTLDEKGLLLQYGEYDIAPYAAGLPSLVIPYDKLQGILKPEYLPETVKVAKP